MSCTYVNALQLVVFAHDLQHSLAELVLTTVKLKLKQSLPVLSSHCACLVDKSQRIAIRVACGARAHASSTRREEQAMASNGGSKGRIPSPSQMEEGTTV